MSCLYVFYLNNLTDSTLETLYLRINQCMNGVYTVKEKTIFVRFNH